MSIHNKKTARLLQGVALGLIIISATLLLGCETPVGGIEQKPIEELVGKVYKSRWNELFYISSADTIEIGYQYEDEEKNIKKVFESKGKIIDRTTTEKGTVYLLQCSNHTNYGPNQYPGYNTGSQENPHIHSDCYTLVYVRSSSTQSVEWATFNTSVDTKKTACFDSNSDSLPKAKEYLDFNKWDPLTYGCSTGIAQN